MRHTIKYTGPNWRLLSMPLVVIILLAALVISCATVPLTGRKQLILIPESNLNSMSFQQYSQFVSENKLSTDTNATAMVKQVGQNISAAVEKYFAARNMQNSLAGYRWEFNLIDDPTVNAWCMPGGKVVVYTGLLPVAEDETGLAVVMGHEIAHAIANHGNERMSQGLLTQFGGMALSEALKKKPEKTRNLFLTAFGAGAQLGMMLPFSRLHESEADRMGLIFMAMAGYDPRVAVDFWSRMASQKEGSTPPEFLSTHPSDQTRISKIKELLPEAMTHYQARK